MTPIRVQEIDFSRGVNNSLTFTVKKYFIAVKPSVNMNYRVKTRKGVLSIIRCLDNSTFLQLFSWKFAARKLVQ